MREGASRVRTFSGRTMEEALARVRGDLGPEAVILLARQVRERKWWGPSERRVEVTAGIPVVLEPGPASVPAVRPGEPGPRRPLAAQVAELRAVVDQLRKRNTEDLTADHPAARELGEKLSAQGLPGELVSGLLDRLMASPGALADRAKARMGLLSLLERLIPTAGPVRFAPGRPARVALVGPTGVGKTTTIAKLAAHFRLREGRSVGFIAADTYRIAAVEQLKRYAELMSAPVRVVRSPEDMSRAAAALWRNDIIFIDTAGRSHRNRARMDELRRVVDAARADEVHLVLSLTSERRSLFSAIDRFAALRPNRLILTKLDEAERTGALLQASARTGLPVSYLTTGQEVPDDIELADSARLAGIVLEGPPTGLRGPCGEEEPLRRSA